MHVVGEHPELLQRYNVVVGIAELIGNGSDTLKAILGDILQAPAC